MMHDAVRIVMYGIQYFVSVDGWWWVKHRTVLCIYECEIWRQKSIYGKSTESRNWFLTKILKNFLMLRNEELAREGTQV